eukprot:7779848-Ditylum_brightwellii.AAC.1
MTIRHSLSIFGTPGTFSSMQLIADSHLCGETQSTRAKTSSVHEPYKHHYDLVQPYSDHNVFSKEKN